MTPEAEEIYKRLKPRRRRLDASGAAAEAAKPATKTTAKTPPKAEA